VIGFDRVVSELLGDMAGGRHQLVEHGWVGNRLIGGDLDRGRPVFKGAGRIAEWPPGPASRQPTRQ
jgi:hypothetical protein